MDFDLEWDWYDPDFPVYDDRDDDYNKNKPVDPDNWSNSDLEGGY